MNDRQQTLLETVINHYIHTADPVGSSVLSQQTSFGLSPATIRNELKTLEEEGYLTHLHTSSGRVPTDKGYRQYVNSILKHQTLSPEEEKKLLTHFLSMGQSVQDVIGQISEILSSLINYTTIVLTPNIYQETLKVTQLVLLDLDRVLVILLNSTGINHEFVLNINENVTQDDLNKVSKLLTQKLSGKGLHSLDENSLSDLIAELPAFQTLLKELYTGIKDLAKFQKTQQKALTKGMANMIRLPEFHNIELTQKVLSTLEENKVLVNILNQYLNDPHCNVIIGQENELEALQDCSLVVAPYSVDSEPAGMIGVLGPKRMAYPVVVPMVKTITQFINSTISNKGDLK